MYAVCFCAQTSSRFELSENPVDICRFNVERKCCQIFLTKLRIASIRLSVARIESSSDLNFGLGSELAVCE